ncbi:PREDICTED: GH3 domain-containing protein isoform X2 [Chinchilla lanigera]|uniref:GH3 domain-containing protein isoform X2 n=1 Tax=Chinchilla lanigera TaxID=34839 RepID=UPI0006972E10|nr:PREDICTED: GH3 domain-containing protein isoform X2 [Chinchilla lanigera]
MLRWLLLLLPPFLLPLLLLLPPAVALRGCLGARLAWLVGLQQRVALGALGWAATWQRRRLDHSTRHAARSQGQALAWCLRGPKGGTDTSAFRNHLPLTTASQAQEEENGGQDQPLTSSQHPREAALQATVLGLSALSKAHPAALAPGAAARVTPTSPWPRPLPWLGPVLGLAGPPGAEDPQALLLAALRSPGLRALEAGTATELLDVFTGLEAQGEELAGAIATGHLGAPLPGRAAELRAALEQGPRGLALRLWPQLQVVVTLDAGGQAEAAAALGALWCQGLAFFSPAFSAAGGLLALSLWPDQPRGVYLLPPGPPFIELLPAKEGTPEGDTGTLLLAGAQQGEEYELVLTDHASLTRCRLGDVVQVVGAHNQCPVVRFIYRLLRGLCSPLRGVPGPERAEEPVGGKSRKTGPLPAGRLPELQVPALPGQRGPRPGAPCGPGGLQRPPSCPGRPALVPCSSRHAPRPEAQAAGPAPAEQGAVLTRSPEALGHWSLGAAEAGK